MASLKLEKHACTYITKAWPGPVSLKQAEYDTRPGLNISVAVVNQFIRTHVCLHLAQS